VAAGGVMPDGRDAGMGVKFSGLDVEGLLALSDYFATLPGGGGQTPDE
jgi:hypothetical protein